MKQAGRKERTAGFINYRNLHRSNLLRWNKPRSLTELASVFDLGVVINLHAPSIHYITESRSTKQSWNWAGRGKRLPIPEPCSMTITCYTNQEKWVITPSLIWLRLLGTRVIRYFRTKVFFTSIRPLLITFATKLCLPRETYILYKSYVLCHQKGDLFVHGKSRKRVLDPIFSS